METLRDSISCLCESWWNSQLAGRDELVPQMLAYLLQRCLEPSPTVVTVVVILFKTAILSIIFSLTEHVNSEMS